MAKKAAKKAAKGSRRQSAPRGAAAVPDLPDLPESDAVLAGPTGVGPASAPDADADGPPPPRAFAEYADLRPDDRNANKGTERGTGLLESSLRRFGAGRSIVVDRNGMIIAGNKTFEQAGALGMPLEFVHTRGDRVVVVVRDDLDMRRDTKARELALADNRVGQINLSWDADVIRHLEADGCDLNAAGWTDAEQRALFDLVPGESAAAAETGGARFAIVVTCRDDEQQRELLERFIAEGLEVKALQ